MLIRSTWTLTTDTPVSLPRSYGLELVKVLHHQLGIELGQEEIPSTTFAGIVGKCTTSQDFITFHPAEFYQLSLSGLQTSSAKAIAALDLGEHLRFLGVTFTILDREDAITSYDVLYHEHVASNPEPVHQFALNFITPTAFSQSRLYMPLPVPTLMFRSWLERWNQFAPVYLGGDELIGYLGETVALSRHRLQTRSHRVHNSHITGFTGEITLNILNRTEPLLANVANLLLQYAQFTGTGTKTRLGMGFTLLRDE